MTKTKEKTKVKPSEPKQILYELVTNSEEKRSVVVFALAEANLLKQYKEERAIYGIKDIAPTITETEFKKLLEAVK